MQMKKRAKEEYEEETKTETRPSNLLAYHRRTEYVSVGRACFLFFLLLKERKEKIHLSRIAR